MICERPTAPTEAGIAKALRWPADALDRIASGEDPADLPTVDSDGEERYGQQGLTQLAAVAALFEALPPDEQRRILSEMAELAANQIKDPD